MSGAEERLKQHAEQNGRTYVPPVKKELPPQPDPKDVDDEDPEVLLKKIQKVNPLIKSLDDLKPPPAAPPTAEEIEEKKKVRKKNALTYGITNEIINTEELVAFERDSEAKPDEIAFQSYLADFRENIKDTDEENDYTDESIRDIFESEFGLDQKEGSARRKLGEKKLEQMKDSYLKNKYSKVLGLEKTYDEYEDTINKAHQYKGVVEDVFSALPEKLTFNLKGRVVPFQPTKETVAKVKELYLNENSFKTFKDIPLTKEAFTAAITHNLAILDLDNLLSEVSETYFDVKSREIGMGRQGIVERDSLGEGNIPGQTSHSGEATKNANARLDQHKREKR